MLTVSVFVTKYINFPSRCSAKLFITLILFLKLRFFWTVSLFRGSVGGYKGFGGSFCLHLYFNREDGGSNFLRIIVNQLQGYTMPYSEDPNLK
jgi:hypothetical protein